MGNHVVTITDPKSPFRVSIVEHSHKGIMRLLIPRKAFNGAYTHEAGESILFQYTLIQSDLLLETLAAS